MIARNLVIGDLISSNGPGARRRQLVVQLGANHVLVLHFKDGSRLSAFQREAKFYLRLPSGAVAFGHPQETRILKWEEAQRRQYWVDVFCGSKFLAERAPKRAGLHPKLPGAPKIGGEP